METQKLRKILNEIDPGYKDHVPDLYIAHVLKSWPLYFNPMRQGVKRFDVRKKEGRNFYMDQYIIYREWDPISKEYSGQWDLYCIQYIAHGEILQKVYPNFDPDMVIMDLKHISRFSSQAHP